MGYDLSMLNKIQPALYQRLKHKSGLSRRQFAALAEVSPNTLANYESGQTRPDVNTEAKMVAAARCSDLEITEMLCEILSEELGMRVGILDAECGYRPATAVVNAEQVLRFCGGDLPERRRHALDNKIHNAQLTRLLYERQNADLDEYAADCRAEAQQRRKDTADALTAEPIDAGRHRISHRG